MPYRRSRARDDFEQRVTSLKKCAQRTGQKNLSIPYDIAELAFRGAILECSASLEEYVKALFSDYGHKVVSENLPLSYLPIELRSFLFLNKSRSAFEKYVYFKNEKKAIKELRIENQVFDLADGTAASTTCFDFNALHRDRKYPSPKNWKLLFQRVGIFAVFNSASAIMKRDSLSILESLNDVRTAIAHEQPPPLTKADVERHLDNSIALVSALDRLMCKHLCKHGTIACWPI